LDDGDYIKSIADLISADPALKPTTAIKSLGISNPSTIRRLRDKYNAFLKSASTAAKPSKHGSNSVAGTSRANGHSETAGHMVAATASASKASRRKRRTPPAQNPSSAQQSDAAATDMAATSAVEHKDVFAEQAKWLGMLCEIGIHGMSSAMMINATACKSFVALPQVKWACQSQIAVNQMVLEMMRRSTHPESSTVH
jgi:hypothetical protein